MTWGHHLMLDCSACDRHAIASEASIRAWLTDLLTRIDMKPIGSPWIELTGQHDRKLAGLTLMQCIETSSITAHFVDSDGSAYIDVFSCKPFEKATVMDCVAQHFNPEGMSVTMRGRQA